MKLHAMEHAFEAQFAIGTWTQQSSLRCQYLPRALLLSSTLIYSFVQSHYCSQHALEVRDIILTDRRQTIGEASTAWGVGLTTAPDTLCITG